MDSENLEGYNNGYEDSQQKLANSTRRHTNMLDVTRSLGRREMAEVADFLLTSEKDGGIPIKEIEARFGKFNRVSDLFRRYEADELFNFVENYMRGIKIKPNDEVFNPETGDIFLVTRVQDYIVYGIDREGFTYQFPIGSVRRTGRVCSGLAETVYFKGVDFIE